MADKKNYIVHVEGYTKNTGWGEDSEQKSSRAFTSIEEALKCKELNAGIMQRQFEQHATNIEIENRGTAFYITDTDTKVTGCVYIESFPVSDTFDRGKDEVTLELFDKKICFG